MYNEYGFYFYHFGGGKKPWNYLLNAVFTRKIIKITQDMNK